MYEYKAIITNVVDGDTYDFEIDLGFGITYNDRLRLYGVDTPEVRGKERPRGLVVKEHVKHIIEGEEVILRTYKWKGKYGRFIAKVFFQLPTSKKLVSLGDYLVDNIMAKKVDY